MSDDREGMQYLRGSLYGLAAVSIWSGWIVVARLGLRTSLTPWDIAALRFGVAGLILLPYVFRKGLAFDRLGWLGLAAIVLGGAAPVFFANSGLLFAPAAHAGALFPGVMPLMVTLLAAALLREEFDFHEEAWFRPHPAWRARHRVGLRQRVGITAECRAWAFSECRPGVGLLHGCDAEGSPRWLACRSDLRCRVHASLSASFRFDARSHPRQRLLERLGIAGLRPGRAHGNHLPAALWPRCRDPGRFERRSLRRTMPGGDRAFGNPDPRRVAEANRLDGDRSDFGRSLYRKRWTAASTVPMMSVR